MASIGNCWTFAQCKPLVAADGGSPSPSRSRDTTPYGPIELHAYVHDGPEHVDVLVPTVSIATPFTPTKALTPSRPETYSRYYTPQQQIDQAQSSSSGTSAPQPTSQAILPVFHENPSPPAKTAEDDSMADADCEPEIGSICEECKEVVGDNCRCYLFGC